MRSDHRPKPIPMLQALPTGPQIVNLSQWDGRISATHATADGVIEALVRFGTGYYADPYALGTWRAFANLGARLSSWWYFEPTLHADLQARYFIAMIDAASHIRTPEANYLDCESAPPWPPKQPAVPILEALTTIDRVFPNRQGIYTRREWWHRHVGRSPTWASRYKLWLAEWNPARPAPTLPDPWLAVGAELWQIGRYPTDWAPDCAAVDYNRRLKGALA